MANFILTHIVEGPKTLSDDDGDVFFFELIPVEHIGKQVSSLTIVCDDEQHIVPFPNFSNIEDVWVVQLAQNLILVDETVDIRDPVLTDNLDGYTSLSQPILGLVNNAKTALSYFLFKEVFILNITKTRFKKLSFLYNHVFIKPFIYVDLIIIRVDLRIVILWQTSFTYFNI